MSNITFGILTVSDSCAKGQAKDNSGANLKRILSAGSIVPGAVVLLQKCIPDDGDEISATLEEWADSKNVDVILTTGGTGFGPRDVTPEATKRVIEREAPGITFAILKYSLEITPYAMLSRSVSGIRKSTLIVNLPGSTKASEESFASIAMAIPHSVALLKDRQGQVREVHAELQGHSHHHHHHHHVHNVHNHHQHHHQHKHHHHHSAEKSEVDISLVARRHRVSPYPLVSVSEAQTIILQHAQLLGKETVNLLTARGRVLVTNIWSREALPPFPASVKDGYAVLVSDGAGPRIVGGQSTAGVKPGEQPKLQPGQCMRINTGAPVPDGADAVVQVESTKLLKETEDGKEELEVDILVAPVLGQDIRPPGCDIKAGELLLNAGTILAPSELGLLASVGITKVEVYRIPCVAVLSTGNELQDPSQPLSSGCIWDSNKTTLMALIAEHGFHAIDMGIAKDDPRSMLRELKSCLSSADVVVTTGSVSMGERDMLKEVLTVDLGGTVHFGRVFMKPGKPTAFITLEYEGKKKLVLGLPGNPVSATVTSHLYVLPLLRKLSGHSAPLGTVIEAMTEEDISLDPRPEYHRAILSWKPGCPVPFAKSTGNQMSSRLLSLSSANALLLIPPISETQTTLPAGSKVEALIISRL